MNADTHSEYGILIAFTQQKSSRERASMLCLHLRCPVVYVNVHTVESDVIKLKTSNLQIHTHTYTHTHTPHTHTTDTTHTPHTHTHTHIHIYIYIDIDPLLHVDRRSKAETCVFELSSCVYEMKVETYKEV